MPEWRARMKEWGDASQAWSRLAPAWSETEAAFLRKAPDLNGAAPEAATLPAAALGKEARRR
jgi:hypothetical protein